MDVIERLTLEAARADTMLACEHRHRYEFAASLCGGRKVLDLCCGSGYGTAILAGHARQVLGVDNDAATIDTAQVTVGGELANVGFELADAVAYLRGDLSAQFDAIVCFEGLEHLADLDSALALLLAHAERGVRIVASVPNGKLFGEENRFHVTEFGYREAMEAIAPFPDAVMVPQFLAEGSLICPVAAQETDVRVSLEDRNEPQYANHFIFCVGFERGEVERAHHGRIQVNVSPVFNRWAEDLKRGARALRGENARLARARLGKSGSAGAAALARLADREAQVAALTVRCHSAEARVSELEAALAGGRAGTQEAPGDGRRPSPAPTGAGVQVRNAEPVRGEPGEDPNSWEMRRRRAAEALIPWIERTVSLTGKTVLEYGCGNAAVSCAFAERAGRVIGVDIDPGAIELGREEVRKRGLANVELELHPASEILDAVSARRGQVDVVLLYAVLEHLTVPERLQVLRLAREVVDRDGTIVVCETPNRLTYFDHHTAQMPFFHLLPDDLALDYYHRSERGDFKDAIDDAARAGVDSALEAIVRWGRGVSFHEFEVIFGDLSRHVIASNYDPELFGERPLHPEEAMLSRYLMRWRPDLAPVWSRSWLDLILSPHPIQKRQPFLRPWIADTTASRNVGWTGWENMYLPGPDATLSVNLPHPTSRLVVGTVTDDGATLALRARAQGTDQAAATVAAPAGQMASACFSFAQATQRIALTVSSKCHIVFVGYED